MSKPVGPVRIAKSVAPATQARDELSWALVHAFASVGIELGLTAAEVAELFARRSRATEDADGDGGAVARTRTPHGEDVPPSPQAGTAVTGPDEVAPVPGAAEAGS